MSSPPSPSTALVALGDSSENDQQLQQWRAIFHGSDAVVLYNPTSHALAFRNDSFRERGRGPPLARGPPQSICPYCKQIMPEEVNIIPSSTPTKHSRVPNYFHLLALANDASSNSLPNLGATTPSVEVEQEPYNGSTFPPESIAQGYFSTFFREERRLGMGANGSVYLCQHVLNGNPLGYFAVKKVAIGNSPEYLVNLLREVRLLEKLHHPNIINYHHAWLETCQFSSFGRPIPTLHILMQWAEEGSLDEFIEHRLGHSTRNAFQSTESPADSEDDVRTRSARIRAFRKKQSLPPKEREAQRRRAGFKAAAVHLMSAEEIQCLFTDIVLGLGFLHSKSILHLDLKPLNVLLTRDEDKLIPRAMLSDFGTSQDMLSPSRVRSGNTGTLEYCAPESVYRDPTGLLRPIDSRADMWSLGMVLYKMVFFSLPFQHAEGDNMDALEQEILNYTGFRTTSEISATIRRRSLPRAILVLLESLLNTSPLMRPTCEQVINAVKEGKIDPMPRSSNASEMAVSVVPRRPTPPYTTESIEKSSAENGSPDDEKSSSEYMNVAPQVTLDTVGTMVPSQIPSDTLLTWNTFNISRLTKTILVFLKVYTLYFSCGPAQPKPSTMFAVLAAALIDTWIEGWWSLLIFAFIHFFIIKTASCAPIP